MPRKCSRPWTRDPKAISGDSGAQDEGREPFHSYFDWYRNVDDPRFNREEGKVLVHEAVPPGAALLAGLACFAAAVPPGIALAVMAGPAVLAAGALSLLVGFLYSGGPRPLSFTPLGELFSGGFLGSVFFCLSYYIFAEGWDSAALFVSLPQAAAIGSILSTNNACDMAGDRAAGRRTLALVLGERRAPRAVYLQGAAGLVLIPILSGFGLLPPLSGFAALPAGIALVLIYRRMGARGYSHDTKGVSMGNVSAAFLVQSAAFAAGPAFELVRAAFSA